MKMICSTNELFERNVSQLICMLRERNYDLKQVHEVIEKVRRLDRMDLLKVKAHEKSEKTVFVYPFYPQLPSISGIINSHKNNMFRDKELEKVFNTGFTVAHNRNRNLTDMLCKAKLYSQNKNENTLEAGWFQCNKCTSCAHSMTSRKEFHFYVQNSNMKIQSKLSCLDKNVIYIIECRRCIVQYGGSTEQQYRLRCDQWRSDIRLNKKQSQVIEHFNIKGHALERDFRMIAIEKVFGDRDTLRIRERMYMDKYNLLESGLNSKRT